MNAPEGAPEEVGPEGAARQEPAAPSALDTAPPGSEEAPPGGLEALRGLLLDPERRRVDQLEAHVAELDIRTQDRDALVATITPVLGDVIRRKIQDSRDEMIEALYPIIGQLIGRAVAEAISDLARTIDSRMRTSFNPQSLGRRLRARIRGIPESALALRDALPFRVSELFLIHREDGLLLRHLSDMPKAADDSDLISGMLTAIRDFAHDAFGQGQEGQLDAIQYGTRRILIEASRHAYLAVVVDGIEPPGFRALMRDRIIAFENEFAGALADYDGDASRFASADTSLVSLWTGSEENAPAASQGVTPAQRRIAVSLGVLLILCVLATCLGGFLIARNALRRTVPVVLIVVTATPAPTDTPTVTPRPTATPQPTATPTPAATATPTPTASPAATAPATATATPAPSPVAYVNVEGVNIREGPSLTYRVLERAPAGRTYVIVGRDLNGGWWQVCCTQSGEVGWLAAALAELRGDSSQVRVAPGP